MQGVVRALAAAVGVFLLVLFGFPVALGAVPEAPGESAPVYVYAGHHYNSAPTSGTVDRGPPSTTYADVAHNADGPGPRGALARPNTVAGSGHSTYDEPIRSAQVTVLRTTTTAAAVPSSGISALSEPASVARKAVETRTRVADNAFKHGHAYHPRIRQRGVQDPRGHNLPYSFDDVILREKPTAQADGSLLYRKSGEINRKPGVYEIALNPDSGVIFHRPFRSTR